MRILLVENHADTANCLRVYLIGSGHEVLIAATVSKAREVLAHSAFDVLISDISLPDGDGWELMSGLDSSSIYGIAMSGFCTDADERRSQAAGFRHHLAKPFVPAELDTLLEMIETDDNVAA
ncbi:MAG: response regulator [Chthoniobacterales bacterium]